MDRYDRARQRGTYDRPLGRQTEAQKRRNDAMAKAAERYAAAYLDADLAIIEAQRPDRGYDLITPAGTRVDVKWTHWNPGQRYGRNADPGYPTLWIWKPIRCDVVLLVCGELEADFTRNEWAHGWMSRRELLAQPIIQSELTGTARAIGFDFLHPLAELG